MYELEIEQVEDAETVDEMRAEIFRLEHYDPLVRSVMDMANYSGMSAEDRFVRLSYVALKEKARLHKLVADYMVTIPMHPIIIPDSEDKNKTLPEENP